MTVYLLKIATPPPATAEHPGRAVFAATGCQDCHTRGFALAGSVDESLGLPVTVPVDNVEVWSDYRRHVMAHELADFAAFDNHPHPTIGSHSFVTPPLWDLARSGPYLHDGSAATLDEAIASHGGEAEDARDAYLALSPGERAQLLDFLANLGRD